MFRFLHFILMTLLSLLPPGICTCHSFHDAEQATSSEEIQEESYSRRTCGCTERVADPVGTLNSNEINAWNEQSNCPRQDDSEHSPQCHSVLSNNGAVLLVADMQFAILVSTELVIEIQQFAASQTSTGQSVSAFQAPLFVLQCCYLV